MDVSLPAHHAAGSNGMGNIARRCLGARHGATSVRLRGVRARLFRRASHAPGLPPWRDLHGPFPFRGCRRHVGAIMAHGQHETAGRSGHAALRHRFAGSSPSTRLTSSGPTPAEQSAMTITARRAVRELQDLENEQADSGCHCSRRNRRRCLLPCRQLRRHRHAQPGRGTGDGGDHRPGYPLGPGGDGTPCLRHGLRDLSRRQRDRQDGPRSSRVCARITGTSGTCRRTVV